MKKAEVIDELRAVRQELEELLVAMTPEQMQRTGVAGDWSVRDVLAHLLWYQREELDLILESGTPASALWDVPQDPRNALIREELRDRPLDEVLAELRQVFVGLVAAVERLSDADLITPGRFPGTSAERLPWQDIGHNSWMHEHEHVAMIRTWLQGQGGAP
jgi:uncharacterized protein (TIGR03083 family)